MTKDVKLMVLDNKNFEEFLQSSQSNHRSIALKRTNIFKFNFLCAKVFTGIGILEYLTMLLYWFDFTTRNYSIITEGRIVGIVSVRKTFSKYYIYNFGLLPFERCKGLSESAIVEILKMLDIQNEITLKVDRRNFIALRLYKKCGFIEKD